MEHPPPFNTNTLELYHNTRSQYPDLKWRLVNMHDFCMEKMAILLLRK